MPVDPRTRVVAGIALAVAAGATAVPAPFWHAFATRSVPRQASLMAAAASGVIIALDVARRRSSARP